MTVYQTALFHLLLTILCSIFFFLGYFVGRSEDAEMIEAFRQIIMEKLSRRKPDQTRKENEK